MVHKQCNSNETPILTYAAKEEMHSEAFADAYRGAFPGFQRPGGASSPPSTGEINYLHDTMLPLE
jgi:hypothetical protein